MKTVVFQSYRIDNVPPWIATCMNEVRNWSATKKFDYRYVDDRIFDLVPTVYRNKTKGRLPVLSDLARLIMARNLILEGYEKTIWIDADVLIFDQNHFDIKLEENFSFCREIWIQPSVNGLKVFRNVHNAVCFFVKGNSFLDFYIDACLQIVAELADDKAMVNQLVGPKLLTALHNMIGYPLIENVGMLSPLVLQDIESKLGGSALDLLVSEMPSPLQAANLCSSFTGSVVDGINLNHKMMERVVDVLLETKGGKLNSFE